MNHSLYRIVFNVRRGQLMAVAETARTQGKSTVERGGGVTVGGTSGRPAHPAWRPLAVLVALIGVQGIEAPQALAQVVAYRNAPGNQQATVLSTGNGVPQVNIQTPSDAGVSHNTYSQFDVDSKGVVLNNSRKGATSQTGGQVAGNPWLAKGTAKVILNEVVSSDPSKLNGAVEVAGDRAEVVIANPAGVEVDGGGFINASRVTITTGKTNLKNGAIDSYDVKQGTVTVGAKGLDASQADYAALLARAVKINGALQAKELRIVTGANRISADHKTVTRIAGTGAAPEYALDVSELGGMYAGKIVMVGTEAGVGVRNAGKISASAGEFTLTVDGKLVNTGQIVTDGNAELEARAGVSNKGSAYAKGNIKIVTDGTLENTGLIGAQGDATLTARGDQGDIVSLAGSSLIAGMTPDGMFIDSGKLTLDAGRRAQANGTNRAGTEIAVTGQVIGIWDSSTSAPLIRFEVIPNNTRRSRLRRDNGGRLLGRSEDEADGTIDASAASIYADDLLVMWTDGLLRTDNANIFAGRIEIGAYDISNRAGHLTQSGSALLSIDVSGLIDNTSGTIRGGGGVTLRAAGLDNDNGQIGAGGMLNVDIAGHLGNGTGTIAGAGGTAVAAGSLDSNGFIDGPVTTRDYLTNSGSINGAAIAGTDLANTGQIAGGASAGGSLSNAGSIGGTASAGTTLDNSGTIAGSANAGGDLTNSGAIGADATSGGKLESSGQIVGNATAKGDLRNSGFIGGNAEAGSDLADSDHIHGGAKVSKNVANGGDNVEDIPAGGHLTNSGTIVGNATASGNLDNSGKIGGPARAAGSLSNGGEIYGDATAGASLGNTGMIGGSASAGATLSNSGSIAGSAGANGDLYNGGSIGGSASAGGSLGNGGSIGGSASAGGSLDNSGGIGGSASAGGSLNNAGGIGGSANAGTSLDNGGTIGGNASANGHLGNAGNIGGSVSGADLGNTGTIGGGAHITGAIDNAGTLGANGNAIIDAASIKNTGTIGSTLGATAINTQSLDNSHGTLQGGDGLFVVSQGKLDNASGNIQSNGALAILDGSTGAKTLDIVNTGGNITGGTAVVIDTATLGRDGHIVSHGAFSASLNGDYTQGVDNPFFEAAGPVSLQFSGTVTNDTVWHNDAGLSVTGGQVVNTGEISSNGITQVHATDGNLTNHGLIQGQQVAVSGADLDNSGGRILGDTLSAQFTGNANNAGGIIDITGASDIRIGGNLNNTGGRIDTGSLGLDVGGDLINRSEANGARAGITARNGDLDLNIGGNLTLQGADLSASGNLHGFVLGNIQADAPAQTQPNVPGSIVIQPRAKVSHDSTAPAASSTDSTAADLHAGGDLSLIAGGNARYEGLDITAGGDLTLGAVTGDLAIGAQVISQTAHSDDSVNYAMGDTDGNQLTTVTDTTTQTTRGGQLGAGGTVNLLAGHDLDLTGVDTHAGGDLNALAGHDLRAGGIVTRDSERIQKSNPNAATDDNGALRDSSANTTETVSLKHHGGHLDAQGDITLDAGHGNPFSAGMVGDVQAARTAAGMDVRADAHPVTGIAPRLAAHSTGPGETPGTLTLDGIDIAAGSETARRDITLAAAGDVRISGASDSTTVTQDAGQFTGQGIMRAAQGLGGPLVTTTTANPSGHLAGNNISIHSDQGSVTLDKLDLHASQDLTVHSGTTTQIDTTTLTAGRDLRVNSIGDLTAQGSDLTAGNALSLVSQGNLSISGSSDHQQTGGKNDLHIRDTGKASTLTGQTIILAATGQAGTDAEGKHTGSNIDLTHVALTSTGQTLISASGDITVDPGQNYAYDYKHESHSSGFIAEKTTTTDHLIETTTILASTVKAGSLDVRALGDIKITATEFDLKGDSSIQAAGKIDYLAAHNETRNLDDSTTSRGILNHEFKRTTDHHDSASRTALVTSIQSEADVLSHSDGDTTMQGTHIETTGHVRIEAKGNIKLDAVENSNNETQYQEHYDRIKEGGIKPVIHAKDHDETGTIDTTLTGVSLHGNTFTLIAGGSITGTAADLVARNGGDLYAGGAILLDAGQETHTTRHTQESTSIGYSTVKTDGRTHIAGVNHNTTDGRDTDTTTTSVGSHLDGGAGKITTYSAGDTLILGGKIEAQAGIDLYAGGKLMLGGSTEGESLNHFTETGTFIGKGRDGHDYQDGTTTSHATELTTQGDIKLHGETQIILGNADLKSGGKTVFDTPNLVFSPESTLASTNHQDWDKDRGYYTQRTEGRLDQSLVYAKLDAKGGIEIDKSTRISVGIDTGKAGADGQPVQLGAEQYRQIATQLSTQPGLGYLKDLAGRSDIDWQAVSTAHQNWNHKGQGMTQEGAIVLTIVVAVLTSGAGAEAVGTEGAATTSVAADGAVATSTTTSLGGTALSTTTQTVAVDGAVTTGTTYTAAGAALNAGFTSLATTAAISLANNGGDIGKTLHDLGSKETVRNTVASMITAGITNADLFGAGDQARSLNDLANVSTVPGIGSVGKFNWDTLGQNVGAMVGRSLVSAGVSSAILGTDFKEGFRNNLVGDFAAVGANAIGTQFGAGSTNKNPYLQTVAHGVLGCAMAAAKGGDCKSGAVGGMVESALGNLIGDLPTDGHGNYSALTRGLYTGAAVIAADVVSDQLHLKTGDAMAAAQNAATNNRLATQKEKDRYKQLAKATGISADRLEDAGCTKIKCSAEFAPGSKEFLDAQDQERRGAQDEAALKVVGQEMGKNGEFLEYTLPQQYFVDPGKRAVNQATEGFSTARNVVTYQAVDDAVLQPIANDIKQVNDTYAVTTRAGGAAQTVGGVLTGTVGVGMIAAGGATCLETGVGCLVAAGGTALTGWSVDQTKAGSNALITGEAQRTYGGTLISDTLGVSPQTSEFAYGLVGLSPAVVEGVALNRASSNYAAANAWARGTYTGASSVTYEGGVYRYTLPEYASGTWNIYPSNIAADHRYSPTGVGAVYAGTSESTAASEVASYQALDGRVLVKGEVVVSNVLDLTNPAARQALGITLEDITIPTHGGAAYEVPQRISFWAREQGYGAILAPSAQSPYGAPNLVSFKPLTSTFED